MGLPMVGEYAGPQEQLRSGHGGSAGPPCSDSCGAERTYSVAPRFRFSGYALDSVRKHILSRRAMRRGTDSGPTSATTPDAPPPDDPAQFRMAARFENIAAGPTTTQG